uniref:Uncharacterized protein n=1 Tax=Oryza meridionalis TaxID=40149 RepID=A0A0E0CYQ3_9ORYZ
MESLRRAVPSGLAPPISPRNRRTPSHLRRREAGASAHGCERRRGSIVRSARLSAAAEFARKSSEKRRRHADSSITSTDPVEALYRFYLGDEVLRRFLKELLGGDSGCLVGSRLAAHKHKRTHIQSWIWTLNMI